MPSPSPRHTLQNWQGRLFINYAKGKDEHACNSISGYITNDYENKISYLSTRLAVDKNVSLLLKQAAIRSLSCEVVPGKEGQIYFGDAIRGHVLSHTFFLKDTQARGFHRWYSVVVFMRDKHFLLNSWSFFLTHIKQLVYHLQAMATHVYENEQDSLPQRSLRLAHLDQSERDTRSLIELTGCANVFAKIHLWFSWLLSIGAHRLEEHLPTRPLECNLSEKDEYEGFVIVGEEDNSTDLNSEIVREMRKLQNILGRVKFQTLIYSTLVGHQIVIRGSKQIVQHIIKLLKFFLPQKKCHCLEYAEAYQTPEMFNIIGLNLYAAVPKPTCTILRLDIVPRNQNGCINVNSQLNIEDFELLLKTAFEMPLKCPTLLTKAEKALSDSTMSDRVVYFHMQSLMEEWINVADIIIELKKKRKLPEVTGLFQCLGVQDQDYQLIDFWTS